MKNKSKTATKRTPSKTARSATSHNVPKPVAVIPGEIIAGEGDIIALHGRQTCELTVSNTGDRPIQVGSHCHFFESNRALKFDREKSYGFRLLVPAGTAVRFEPGESKRVTLVALGGNRVAYGINGLVNGKIDDSTVRQAAFMAACEQGFMDSKRSS